MFRFTFCEDEIEENVPEINNQPMETTPNFNSEEIKPVTSQNHYINQNEICTPTNSIKNNTEAARNNFLSNGNKDFIIPQTKHENSNENEFDIQENSLESGLKVESLQCSKFPYANIPQRNMDYVNLNSTFT